MSINSQTQPEVLTSLSHDQLVTFFKGIHDLGFRWERSSPSKSHFIFRAYTSDRILPLDDIQKHLTAVGVPKEGFFIENWFRSSYRYISPQVTNTLVRIKLTPFYGIVADNIKPFSKTPPPCGSKYFQRYEKVYYCGSSPEKATSWHLGYFWKSYRRPSDIGGYTVLTEKSYVGCWTGANKVDGAPDPSKWTVWAAEPADTVIDSPVPGLAFTSNVKYVKKVAEVEGFTKGK